MSECNRAASTAAVVLLLLACAGRAYAEDPAGQAEERDVPEPQVPGVETLPPGVSPDPWTSWATGQDVDSIPRIGIDLSFGTGTFAPSPAGSGTEAPTHSEFNDVAFEASLRLGYDLSPALALVLGALMIVQDSGSYSVEGPSGPLEIRSKDDGTVAGFIGLRLSLPLAHLGGRLLEFTRTEAPTGVNLQLLAGIGPAMIAGMNVYYDGGAPYFTEETHEYWGTAVNPGFFLGLRIEYRWVNFGLFADFTMAYLGRPEPSQDPLWAESSVAGPMVPLLFNLGFSLHF